MSYDPYDDEPLPERKPVLVRVVALIVAVTLFILFTDLFFELIL